MQQPISYTNLMVEDRRFSFSLGASRPVLLAEHLCRGGVVTIASTVRWGSNFGYVAFIDEHDLATLKGFKLVPAVALGVGTDPKELVQTMEDFEIHVEEVVEVVRADHILEMTPRSDYYFKRLYASCNNKIHDIKPCSVKQRMELLADIATPLNDPNYFSFFLDVRDEITKFLTKRKKKASGKSVTIPRVPFGYFCHLANSFEHGLEMKRSKTSYSLVIKNQGDLKFLFGEEWWKNNQGCGVLEGIFPVTLGYNLKGNSMRVSFKDLVYKTLDGSVVWDTRKRKRADEEAPTEHPHKKTSAVFLCDSLE